MSHYAACTLDCEVARSVKIFKMDTFIVDRSSAGFFKMEKELRHMTDPDSGTKPYNFG